MFSTKDIAATRITHIGNEIGIAAPTIYYHFDNLASIVEALLRYVVEESAVFASHEAWRAGRCTDRLRSLIEQHIDRLTSGHYDPLFGIEFTETGARRFAERLPPQPSMATSPASRHQGRDRRGRIQAR